MQISVVPLSNPDVNLFLEAGCKPFAMSGMVLPSQSQVATQQPQLQLQFYIGFVVTDKQQAAVQSAIAAKEVAFDA